ncbi:hypothetical protein VP14_164 [Vibrio phage VPMCC14]|nr:hypothetical protein VP14_164 [Vibrio phage VPMCC14]
MTTITENSEYITQLTIIIWCFLIACLLSMILPMIKDEIAQICVAFVTVGFTVGFLLQLHELMIYLGMY